MRLKSRVQLTRMVKRVVSEYRIDNTNLPIDVATEIKRPSLKKEWTWHAWYIHQDDKPNENGFWKRAFTLHMCVRGGLIPNPFSWGESSVGGTCRSEKEANIQSAYAKTLLLEAIAPIHALSVYHELSEESVMS